MRTMGSRYLRMAGAAALLQASVWGGLACSNTGSGETPQQQEETQATARFNIAIDDETSTGGASTGRTLSAMSGTVKGSAFTYQDVDKIVIDVWETSKNRDTPLYINYALRDEDTGWEGELPFLPKNKALTFSARAYDDKGTLLFSGTTDQTLSDPNQTVVIVLAPANDGKPITLPSIKRISIPSEFGSGQRGNVSFTMEATLGESLSYVITPAADCGAFFPLSGGLTLAGTTGTFVSQYAPPSVTTETECEHLVKVANSKGHAVMTTFKTKTKPNGSTGGVNNTELKVLFNPVINTLTAQRVLGTSNVIFEAGVADDGPVDALTYAWSFAPSVTPAAELSFTDATTNPTTLQGYTTSLQGTLALAVKDGNGGTTTLLYPLLPDQFPDNPIEAGPLTGINSIRGGESHTCVLFNNGGIRCWGLGSSGQLGYGDTFSAGDDASRPISGLSDVPVLNVATKIALGGNHTCALLDNGQVRCWGKNQYGQLGYATTEPVGDSEALASYGYVSLGGNVVKIAAGYEHTCALMETGNVRCWGRGESGQLGYGDKEHIGDTEQPWTKGDVQLDGTVQDIVAGDYHTCALMTTGAVRCWGLNNYGQLGVDTYETIGDDDLPLKVGTVKNVNNVLQLTAGTQHTCALLSTGNVRCWGYNGSYQVGDPSSTYYPTTPGDLSLGGSVLQVSAGGNHTCALLSTGAVKCWGSGGSGQLGNGSTGSQHAGAATAVNLGGATAYQVTAGTDHTCALLSTGKARCWGRGSSGQLGYGNKSNVVLPTTDLVITEAAPQQ